jgi:hypothetical protein
VDDAVDAGERTTQLLRMANVASPVVAVGSKIDAHGEVTEPAEAGDE